MVALLSADLNAYAQAPNPTSATNPFFGSVTAQPATEETFKLSLDDAVRRGLEARGFEVRKIPAHGKKNQMLTGKFNPEK